MVLNVLFPKKKKESEELMGQILTFYLLHTFCKMKLKILLQLKLRSVPVVTSSNPIHIRIQLLSIV
jgi:hypothetical protein